MFLIWLVVFSLADMGLGLVCMIILVLMKMLKDFVDKRMKSVSGCRKVVYKTIWLVCTGQCIDKLMCELSSCTSASFYHPIMSGICIT